MNTPNTGNLLPTQDEHHIPENERQPAIVRLNDGAAQATPSYPVLRTAGGITVAVLANPDGDDAEPDHEPWREIAQQHGQPGADERAIRLAHAIHNHNKPDAVILFGSRATGDYDEQTSDIDIMVISEKKEIDHEHASKLVTQLYDHAPHLELIELTNAAFDRESQYRNTSPTEALLKGLLICSQPERWQSIYQNPDMERHPNYNWSQYKYLATMSKFATKGLHTGIDGKVRGPAGMVRDIIELHLAEAVANGTEQEWRNKSVRANAHASMRYTLMTAIAAAGQLPKKEGNIEHLLQQLEIAVPDLPVKPRLTPEQYRDSEQWSDQQVQELAKEAIADITEIRKLATKVYRRTKRNSSNI